jgi:hypothetical protein
MLAWEYSVEAIKLEHGHGAEWSVHDSPYGETKLVNRLNEFGKWGWELVSIMPVLSEQGTPILPPVLYAVFKRPKE